MPQWLAHGSGKGDFRFSDHLLRTIRNLDQMPSVLWGLCLFLLLVNPYLRATETANDLSRELAEPIADHEIEAQDGGVGDEPADSLRALTSLAIWKPRLPLQTFFELPRHERCFCWKNQPYRNDQSDPPSITKLSKFLLFQCPRR